MKCLKEFGEPREWKPLCGSIADGKTMCRDNFKEVSIEEIYTAELRSGFYGYVKRLEPQGRKNNLYSLRNG
jgi:hypothetical protein